MNQDIKISTVFIILIVFGGLLFARFWAVSNSLSIQVFSYMHHHPDGSSFIFLNNQLLGFDAHGQHTTTVELNRFQIQKNNQTDFAFFSNGDILLRQRSRDNNFIENLQRYLRFSNPTDKTSMDAKMGLFRCSLETFQCNPFTKPALNLNNAFSLAIDWATDRVFLADSSRHRVDMYSETGELLDSQDRFRFPNQIDVIDNRLYVADTNHHSLVAYDISGQRIGDIEEFFDTRTEQSMQRGDVWPAAFLLHHNQRWVINHQNNMKNGGVYIFDGKGEFIKKLRLPNEADPFSILQMGDQVLVTDYSQDRIYRYNLNGKLLGEFNPDVLDNKAIELTKQRDHYSFLSHLFTILFAICLISGMGAGFYQQSRKTLSAPLNKNESATNTPQRPQNQEHEHEHVLHWVRPSNRFKIISYCLIGGMFILLLALMALTKLSGNTIETFLDQYWWLLPLSIISSISLFLQMRRKIGITENSIVIHSPLGTKSTCLKHRIMSHDMMIVANESVFQINKLYHLFSASDVENHLYPAFKQGRQVNRSDMQTVLGKNTAIRLTQMFIITGLAGLFVYYSMF